MDINMPRKNLIHIKRDIQIKPASRGTCGYQKPAIKGDTQSTKQKTSKRETPKKFYKSDKKSTKVTQPTNKTNLHLEAHGITKKELSKETDNPQPKETYKRDLYPEAHVHTKK